MEHQEKSLLERYWKQAIFIIIILFLSITYLHHANWCKQNVGLKTLGYGDNKIEFYSHSSIISVSRYDNYKDAVTSCKAGWINKIL